MFATIYRIFILLCFLFFFCAVLGWVIELFFRRFISKANPDRLWLNPGFLTGPYLPLYGCGVVVLYALSNLFFCNRKSKIERVWTNSQTSIILKNRSFLCILWKKKKLSLEQLMVVQRYNFLLVLFSGTNIKCNFITIIIKSRFYQESRIIYQSYFFILILPTKKFRQYIFQEVISSSIGIIHVY